MITYLLNQRIIKIFLHAIFLLAAGILFNSCFKDYDVNKLSTVFEADPRLAFTIGSTTIRLDEVLKKLDSVKYINQYHSGPDSGLIYVVYDKDLQFFFGQDLFAIPTQNSFNFNIDASSFPFAVFPPGGKIPFSTTINYPISFGTDQRIDSIHIKSMLIDIKVNSSCAGSLKITFPGITLNKDTLSGSVQLTANVNKDLPINADNYFLRFASAATGSSNLALRLDLTLTGNPGDPIGSGLSFNMTTSNFNFYAMYGYAGYTNLLNINDTINLSLLNNNITKNIQWADPRLKLYITNSYVILPIQFNASNMSTNSQSITLNSSINPVDLLYPSSMGSIKNDTIVYSNTNTNLFQALQQNPEYVTFHFDAWSNPNKNTSIENVIVDTSSLKLKAEFYLPIWLRAGSLSTYDTLSFDLASSLDSLNNGKDSINIESMLLKIASENGMPISLKLQVYFANINNNHVGTLIDTTNAILAAAPVDPVTEKVTASTKSLLPVSLNSTQLNALKKTKKLLIGVYFSTTDFYKDKTKYVKFMADYKFKLTFSCKFYAKAKGSF